MPVDSIARIRGGPADQHEVRAEAFFRITSLFFGFGIISWRLRVRLRRIHFVC